MASKAIGHNLKYPSAEPHIRALVTSSLFFTLNIIIEMIDQLFIHLKPRKEEGGRKEEGV